MTDVPQLPLTDREAGKSSAAVIYLLYLLSVPSAGILALLGVIWAYAVRGQAAGWVRTHLDKQVRLFWRSVIWAVAIGLVGAVTVPLLGLGVFVWWAGFGLLTLWLVVVCVLGLISLVQNRPA